MADGAVADREGLTAPGGGDAEGSPPFSCCAAAAAAAARLLKATKVPTWSRSSSRDRNIGKNGVQIWGAAFLWLVVVRARDTECNAMLA